MAKSRKRVETSLNQDLDQRSLEDEFLAVGKEVNAVEGAEDEIKSLEGAKEELLELEEKMSQARKIKLDLYEEYIGYHQQGKAGVNTNDVLNMAKRENKVNGILLDGIVNASDSLENVEEALDFLSNTFPETTLQDHLRQITEHNEQLLHEYTDLLANSKQNNDKYLNTEINKEAFLSEKLEEIDEVSKVVAELELGYDHSLGNWHAFGAIANKSKHIPSRNNDENKQATPPHGRTQTRPSTTPSKKPSTSSTKHKPYSINNRYHTRK